MITINQIGGIRREMGGRVVEVKVPRKSNGSRMSVASVLGSNSCCRLSTAIITEAESQEVSTADIIAESWPVQDVLLPGFQIPSIMVASMAAT